MLISDGRGKLGLIKESEMCEAPTKIMHNLTVVKIASGADHLEELTDCHQVYTMGRAELG